MATPYTTNNGSTFYNKNDCRSFVKNVDTNLSPLTAYACSEVILINKGVNAVEVYDNGFSAPTTALVLSAGETFTLRGITNAAVVSAKASAGVSTLYYRTQFFSLLPQQ